MVSALNDIITIKTFFTTCNFHFNIICLTLMSLVCWCFLLSMKYSRCPKSGRPDFGVFENCPVLKRPVFERSFDNRTILSGYRTSGSYLYMLQTGRYWTGRPITGHKHPVIGRLLYLKRLKTGYNVQIDQNRFQTGLEPVLVPKRLKTGYKVRFSDVWDTVNVR